MKQFRTLLAVSLRQRFGFSAWRAEWGQSKPRALLKLTIVLIVALTMAALVGGYAWLIWAIYPAFEAAGLVPSLMTIVLLLAMLVVLLMGMVYLIGMLYFARDSEFLAALPVPQRTVFASKFAQVLLGELGTALLLLSAPLIVSGIRAGAPVLYWVRMVLVILLAPCLPLAIAALLSMLLMRISALWRRRELLAVVGAVVLLVGIFLLQGAMTSVLPQEITMQQVMGLVSNSEGLIYRVAGAFPPAGWAAQGLTRGGGMLWLFAGTSVAALAVVIWLSGVMYYRGAMAQRESAARVRRVDMGRVSMRRHGALRALFVREWRGVLRSPTYVLNGLIVIVLGPLLMLLPRLLGDVAANEPELAALYALLENFLDGRLVVLVLAGVCTLIGMISPAVTTSVSREGRMFGTLRMIPVTPARQMMAKYLFGVSVGGLTILLMALTATLAFSLPWRVMLGAVALGLVASLPPLALSMLPDTLRPKLAWNSETEAIKQNLNAIFGMLIGWAYVAAAAFGCYLLIKAGLSLSLVIGLATGLSLLLGAATMLLLLRAARYTWRAVEG